MCFVSAYSQFLWVACHYENYATGSPGAWTSMLLDKAIDLIPQLNIIFFSNDFRSRSLTESIVRTDHKSPTRKN